jgi:two-component system nitrogen regulation response regulator GlnG
VKHSPLAKLKKVSGRLRRILSSHVESVNSEPRLPRLLVVDDEQSIRFSMSEYFGLHGFTVDMAREVEEAERLIETTDYSVTILDLRLGTTRNADGLEIVKLVHEKSPKTRVVVLTAYGSAEMEDEARRCGADAFLRKPTPLSQVAQVVQGFIESPPKRAAKSA